MRPVYLTLMKTSRVYCTQAISPFNEIKIKFLSYCVHLIRTL